MTESIKLEVYFRVYEVEVTGEGYFPLHFIIHNGYMPIDKENFENVFKKGKRSVCFRKCKLKQDKYDLLTIKSELAQIFISYPWAVTKVMLYYETNALKYARKAQQYIPQ